jgi:L-ascorbate metabolism protein UlaG (beta-lactamase superfamily)
MKLSLLLTLATGIAAMTFSQTCTSSKAGSNPAIQDRIEASPQFKEGGFNPYGNPLDMSLLDNVRVAWKFLFTHNDRTPDLPLPVISGDVSGFNGGGNRPLNAIWLGHSSLLINMDGYKILTDPVFEKRISIVGPTRFCGDPPLTIDQLPHLDAVIISHDHYDHLNKSSILRLKEKTTRFIVPLGVGAILEKWGFARDHICELDWWEECHLDQNLTVTATPAQHFSGRGLSDRNRTLWASWVISNSVHKVFFSGDSGYFTGFKEIGERFGPFDITFLECGAYDLLWHKVHMLPEETVRAHLDLKGRVLHPIHWGTFNLALHSWYEPMERITAVIKGKEIRLITPRIGETTRHDQPLPKERWWRNMVKRNNKEKPENRFLP